MTDQAQPPGELAEQEALLPDRSRRASTTSPDGAEIERNETFCTQSAGSAYRDINMLMSLPLVRAPQENKQLNQNPPVKSANLKNFFETYVEPTSIKSCYTSLFRFRKASLAFRFGPLIVKRFSQDQEEIFEVPPSGYYGLAIALQLPCYFWDRTTVALLAFRRSQQYMNFTLQWNLSLQNVVPNSALIIKLTRRGDISGMESMYNSGKASPNDVKTDGTSLLHVSFSLLKSSPSPLILRR